MKVDKRNMWLGIGVTAFLIWMLLISICAVDSWETNRSELPKVGTAIDTQYTYVYNSPTEVADGNSSLSLPEWKFTIFKGVYVGELTGRRYLKIGIGDKEYWIEIEEVE